MQSFTYQNGQLFAEDVAVRDLAGEHGTPLYIYSRSHMRDQYRALATAMAEVDPLICFSVKANSNIAVIKTFLALGSGLDIVSGGELFRALRAGADPRKIVFAGVGKTCDEIEYALREDILFFTVESEAEARRISTCAVATGTTGRIAFRVNPDVDPKTHKYISTGKKENKFGLDLSRAAEAYADASRLPNVELSGMHMHIGSQLLSVDPFGEALDRVSPLCAELKAQHASFEYLDIGGGIGIQYEPGQMPPTPDDYAAVVVPRLKALGLSVALEPGRRMVGNAGILVSEVQFVKDNPFKKFIVIDAAMNDLIRPALYQAHHEILAVEETGETVFGDLVGPICESGDFLAADRELPDVKQGDLVAALSAGAYACSMASNYNSRPRPAEVMVDGDQATVVARRETLEDLVRNEVMPGEDV
jgi:diaminopimelate decarboxylase